MNKYFVRYITDTSFSLRHRVDHVKGLSNSFSIKLPDIEIFGYEHLEKIEEKYVFGGIAFQSYVNASTLKKAQRLMQNTVHRILDIFVYVSLSPWINLFLISSYEANKNLSLRKAYYHFYHLKNIELVKAIRPVTQGVFKEVFTKLDKSIFRDNILASFHQLNKGLQSNTDVDEFLSYWTAVEYLAIPLNTKKDYKKVERFHECPFCGKPLSKCQHCHGKLPKKKLPPGIFKRVEEIALEQLNLRKSKFNKIKKTRALIIHGGKWDKFVNSYKYKDLIRNLLIYCIGELLDLKQSSIKLILKKNPIIRNKITTDIEIIYSADIGGLNMLPDIDKPKKHPIVVIKESKKPPITINDDGSVKISNTAEYLRLAKKGIVFNNISYSIYAYKLSGAKNARITLDSIRKAKNG